MCTRKPVSPLGALCFFGVASVLAGCLEFTPPVPPDACSGYGSHFAADPVDEYPSGGSALPFVESESNRKVPGHVPKAVAAARDLGKMDDSQSLELSIALPLNHVDELEKLIAQLHNPASPLYGRFLGSSEFVDRFGPTLAQVERVRSYLQDKGFTVKSVAGNRKLIQVSATHHAVSAAFGTEIHHYLDRDGTPFFAPKFGLRLPVDVPIEGVHGLNNLSRLKPANAGPDAGISAGIDAGMDASSPSTTAFTPSTLRSAYHFPAQFTGTGQTVALFESDGYALSDIQGYEAEYGLPAVYIDNVLVDGVSGTPGVHSDEVTLDVEWMIAAAPGISRLVVYEGPDNDQGAADNYNRIAVDNQAKTVSASWAQAEDEATIVFLQTENAIFMQMAAQGQTVVAAAGDIGAYADGKHIGVNDPACQPYVTGVGGTSVALDSSGNIATETSWFSSTVGGWGGGGGVSGAWTQPSWQSSSSALASQQPPPFVGSNSQLRPANTISVAGTVSTSMRNVPDVSLSADLNNPGFNVFFQGQWVLRGGASVSTPIWGGLIARANQARAANGLGPIGYLNPTLYRLASNAKRYAADFNDIADGSSNGYFYALPGYDDSTGLGTPRADALISDLSLAPAAALEAIPASACSI